MRHDRVRKTGSTFPDRTLVAPLQPSRPQLAVSGAIFRDGKVLLVRRPDGGRWAGLWEFPHGPLRPGEAHEEGAARLIRELTGLHAELGPELLTVRHGITRYRITMVCFEARYRKGSVHSSFYRQGCWVEPGRLPDYPVSAPQRRLAQALIEPARQKRLF